jgi:hypothetical protein
LRVILLASIATKLYFLLRSSGVTGELLVLRDISVEASEDLPRILGALAEDAAAAALGRSGALEQAPLDRDMLVTAIEAGAPALAKLRVGALPFHQAEIADLLVHRCVWNCACSFLVGLRCPRWPQEVGGIDWTTLCYIRPWPQKSTM